MNNLIGKYVETYDGHRGIVIKHFKPTGRSMTVHIKEKDGRVWYCPENEIIYIKEVKMIEKILNNYFNNIYKRILKQTILSTFNIDIEIREYKGEECELLLKPVEYKNYTSFYCWHKKDSLNHLINFQEETIELLKRISNMKWGVCR